VDEHLHAAAGWHPVVTVHPKPAKNKIKYKKIKQIKKSQYDG
jgi:hypothetical protein